MTKRRVVVTGLGIVSPVGSQIAEAWENVVNGRSFIGPITRFDVSAYPTRFGGDVRGFSVDAYLPPKESRRMDPFIQYGYAAAADALKDSGLVIDENNAARVGIAMGAGIGGLETIQMTHDKLLEGKGPRKVSPFFVPASIINMISGHVSIQYGLKGPNLALVSACTTSTPLGDIAETVAVKRTLGAHAHSVAVSSTKSVTGHLLGAAGAVEAIFTVLAIRDQIAPPTINLDNADPKCDLDYVPNSARAMSIDVALSNSFGFGGTNGSLVFRRLR